MFLLIFTLILTATLAATLPRVAYKQGIQNGLLRASNEALHQGWLADQYPVDDPRRAAVVSAMMATSEAIDRIEEAVRVHGPKAMSAEPRYQRHYIAGDRRGAA